MEKHKNMKLINLILKKNLYNKLTKLKYDENKYFKDNQNIMFI